MRRWMCSYAVVEYTKAGEVCGVYIDCFGTRQPTKEAAEEYTRGIAKKWNPDRRVHTVVCKEM